MAKSEIVRTNGNGAWKIVATVGTFVLFAITAAIAYGRLCADVEIMKPEVPKNTEHRVKFEEKVTTMEANIILILTEVREIKGSQNEAGQSH